MKKKLVLAVSLLLVAVSTLTGCGEKKEEVLILSSSEDFRNIHFKQLLDKEFPDYNVQVQYMSTGTAGAKIKAEGVETEYDIIIGLETGYLYQNASILANLSEYNTEDFVEESLPDDNIFLPWERYSGCIAIREDILEEKGLAIPTSYDDLLKPEYKNLISMPNPKASGTGYMFLHSLVNARGEEEGFEYFDALADNVLHFTQSGSGPVNDLIQGEVAIGMGMTFQAVSEIGNGVDIDIHYFEEGAPSTFTGFAMIDGKDINPAVKEVFDYIYNTLVHIDKELFSPEQIFKTQSNNIPNYPQNMKYADMYAENPIETKEHLLENWEH